MPSKSGVLPVSGRPARLSRSLTSRSEHPSKTGRGDPQVERVGRPAGVGLQDLADVHSGRDAQGVEDDLDRGAVGQPGHVLFGHDPGDDALVAVAAGDLVADRELALHGDEDLDGLDDARGELVALLQAFDLVLENGPERLDLALGLFLDVLDPLVPLGLGLDFHLAEVVGIELVQDLLRQLLALGQATAGDLLVLLERRRP